MTSYGLVLQLTSALFAFTAVLGSPEREYDGTFLNLPYEYERRNSPQAFSDGCQIQTLPKNVHFYYYTKNFTSGRIFDPTAPPTSGIYFSAKTKIVTHGFPGNLEGKEIQELIKAYLDTNDRINLLALDWGYYTRRMYREAALNSSEIGKAVSCIICVLQKYFDIHPRQLHFIGHNLGAHLLAFTARRSVKKIGRLTGLSPSRECFEDLCEDILLPAISKRDAEFVDVLHTDCLHSGVTDEHGTTDVYANKGKFQPQCVESLDVGLCESLQAISYYARTIRDPKVFVAEFCTTPYPELKCQPDKTTYYGEYMRNMSGGIYNFNVSSLTSYYSLFTHF